jgi:hypothetical protein
MQLDPIYIYNLLYYYLLKMSKLERLLCLLPNFQFHTNENTIYNTVWDSEEWTDYSIEVVDWKYEIRHTGNTIVLDTIEEVVDYVTD